MLFYTFKFIAMFSFRIYIFLVSFGIIFGFNSCTVTPAKNSIQVAQEPILDSILTAEENNLQFFIVSDWGRNGYFDQCNVAREMAHVSELISPAFIISAGDNFQVHGVQSINDPLWGLNFENIYTHPNLEVDWYPVLGNHDYKGSTKAQIEYSNISRRWKMPAHYYSISKKITNTTSALFLFIDTPPLIESYHIQSETYPDISSQDSAAQLKWIKEMLMNAKEQWIFVVGHHPLYSSGGKHGNTNELITKLRPIIDTYKVDFYISGHDHNFEHSVQPDGYTQYIVTGTGATSRPISETSNTLFAHSETGFTLCTFKNNTFTFSFISKNNDLLYSYSKSK